VLRYYAEKNEGGRTAPIDSPERYQIQQRSFLNLLCCFSIDRNPFSQWCGGYIIPGYTPPGSVFEVEVRIWPLNGGSRTGAEYVVKGRISPNDKTVKWQSHHRPRDSDGSTIFDFDGETLRSIGIGWAPEQMSERLAEWIVRVRLDLAGDGKLFVPQSGQWVEASGESTIETIWSREYF
jgi:hypothetical protein